jgi:polysaccharide deacetylase 2 family uncharacterized protein YibQ
MMKGSDRGPASYRRLAVFTFLGLAAAILCFFLGWLAASRQMPVRKEQTAFRELEQIRPGGSPADNLRPQLARAAELLQERLSACLAAPDGVEKRCETVRDGSGSWEQIHLGGKYRNLEPFFASGLAGLRETFEHDFQFDCLAATDPVSGIFTVLLISGDRVVLIGEFSPLVPPPEPVALGRGPQIAIIIDDMGRSLKVARQLADIELPLTFAVFPHLPVSRQVAALLTGRGRDVMLHLPMEPRGWPRLDPGPGALFCRMGDREFCRILNADLQAVPGIIGVNNHMGSRLTEDPGKMKLVMRALAGTGLFFIDSRTINDSVAWREAAAAGIPVLQRDVFLDNRPVEKIILEQFKVLVEVARSRGYAVGIGHPYPETIAALKKVPALAAAAEVELVAVRELVVEKGGRKPTAAFRPKTD